MWELDCEDSWAQKNWCFWTVVWEKTLESPLDCKIQPVHSKGDQPWDFFGRNDAKAETPVLWPPHVKSWLIGKDSDAGRDWGQEQKGTTEDKMAGWHHWLNGCESEWTPGGGDGQGGLACCDSWGRKESDTTERLNWTELHIRWSKYWSFSFNISPTKEHPGLISFKMDWLDLLAVQRTLKSLLQHHSSKAKTLWHSAFFIVQLSHSYMTTGKTIALTRQTFIDKVMSLLFN